MRFRKRPCVLIQIGPWTLWVWRGLYIASRIEDDWWGNGRRIL